MSVDPTRESWMQPWSTWVLRLLKTEGDRKYVISGDPSYDTVNKMGTIIRSIKPFSASSQHTASQSTFMCPVLVQSVTVLLPGWVIWKYWNCPCKFFSLGSWLVSTLSTPNGGQGYSFSTDLNPCTITSIQLQCIQASRPHLADKTTRKPQPNIVCIVEDRIWLVKGAQVWKFSSHGFFWFFYHKASKGMPL